MRDKEEREGIKKTRLCWYKYGTVLLDGERRHSIHRMVDWWRNGVVKRVCGRSVDGLLKHALSLDFSFHFVYFRFYGGLELFRCFELNITEKQIISITWLRGSHWLIQALTREFVLIGFRCKFLRRFLLSVQRGIGGGRSSHQQFFLFTCLFLFFFLLLNAVLVSNALSHFLSLFLLFDSRSERGDLKKVSFGVLIKSVLPVYGAFHFFYLQLPLKLQGAVFLVLPVSPCLPHCFRRLRRYLVETGKREVVWVCGVDGEIIGCWWIVNASGSHKIVHLITFRKQPVLMEGLIGALAAKRISLRNWSVIFVLELVEPLTAHLQRRVCFLSTGSLI